ncbi:MAG: hypothetical protein A2X49_09730 [Lentisphaerae bacterium GWF2_52_8]|nr:MAG: hypothetical protein A2X49_09730 [Lentisphaerae bacterium GWF2_52_8]
MQERESQLQILIAEDDDAAAQLIRTNLKRAGLDKAIFLRTHNGEETLQLLENPASIPHGDKLVILLDIRMPKLDGIEVLRKLKSSESLRKIPVIMLTTSDRPSEVELCYRLGCNSYLKKQVDYGKFVESIKNFAAFMMSCEIPVLGEELEQ